MAESEIPLRTSDQTGPGIAARPSRFVRGVMGPMTRVFNPILCRLAGRKHFKMAAQIHHCGRRSGQFYTTPASARLDNGVFWIPLTFGTTSDWCRNVIAAGGCTIRYLGDYYEASGPIVVPREAALSTAQRAFKRRERTMLRLIGVSQLLRLEVQRRGQW
jgi:hypothetical protein